MLTYVRAFTSGELAPFWPHFWLLSGSIVAGAAVGAGIIFEGSEYSASTHRVAKWLVIGGVFVESLCTISLFVFDEGISGAQQSKIIALEMKLAPRSFTKDQAAAIIAAAKPFAGQQYALSVAPGSEPLALLCQLDGILQEYAGWKRHAPFGDLQTPTDCIDRQTVSINFASGVIVVFKWGSDVETEHAADALTAALKSAKLEVHAGVDSSMTDANVINLAVGAKL